VVVHAGDEKIAEAISDGEGKFTFEKLPAGSYQVDASLDGFESVKRAVTIAAGGPADLALDLPIAAVSEKIDVVASSPDSPSNVAAAETISSSVIEGLAPGGGVQSGLRLLDTVIGTPAGESIDGGRPDQSGFQIGAATLVDPATNIARVWLPS